MYEQWKYINEYDGLYMISNYGNVYSIPRKNTKGGLVRKDYHFGYNRVTLCKDGKTKKFFVHRLVAQHFLPNPNNLPQVNHKDENKSNNRVDNLEWCTAKENCNYGKRNEKILHKRCKQIVQISKLLNKINFYNSAKDAEKQTGVQHQDIAKCCKGKRKTAGGFIWKYA
jgi:hypothetical protein